MWNEEPCKLIVHRCKKFFLPLEMTKICCAFENLDKIARKILTQADDDTE
jgi:hypothetical protein